MEIIFYVLLLNLRALSVDGFYNNINSKQEIGEAWKETYSRIPFWLQGLVPQIVSDKGHDFGLSDINSESSENDLDYFVDHDFGKVHISEIRTANVNQKDNKNFHISTVFDVLNEILRNAKSSDFDFGDGSDKVIGLSDTNQAINLKNSLEDSNKKVSLSDLSPSELKEKSLDLEESRSFLENVVEIFPLDGDAYITVEFNPIIDDQVVESRIPNYLYVTQTGSDSNDVATLVRDDASFGLYNEPVDDLTAMESSHDEVNLENGPLHEGNVIKLNSTQHGSPDLEALINSFAVNLTESEEVPDVPKISNKVDSFYFDIPDFGDSVVLGIDSEDTNAISEIFASEKSAAVGNREEVSDPEHSILITSRNDTVKERWNEISQKQSGELVNDNIKFPEDDDSETEDNIGNIQATSGSKEYNDIENSVDFATSDEAPANSISMDTLQRHDNKEILEGENFHDNQLLNTPSLLAILKEKTANITESHDKPVLHAQTHSMNATTADFYPDFQQSENELDINNSIPQSKNNTWELNAEESIFLTGPESQETSANMNSMYITPEELLNYMKDPVLKESVEENNDDLPIFKAPDDSATGEPSPVISSAEFFEILKDSKSLNKEKNENAELISSEYSVNIPESPAATTKKMIIPEFDQNHKVNNTENQNTGYVDSPETTQKNQASEQLNVNSSRNKTSDEKISTNVTQIEDIESELDSNKISNLSESEGTLKTNSISLPETSLVSNNIKHGILPTPTSEQLINSNYVKSNSRHTINSLCDSRKNCSENMRLNKTRFDGSDLKDRIKSIIQSKNTEIDPPPAKRTTFDEIQNEPEDFLEEGLELSDEIVSTINDPEGKESSSRKRVLELITEEVLMDKPSIPVNLNLTSQENTSHENESQLISDQFGITPDKTILDSSVWNLTDVNNKKDELIPRNTNFSAPEVPENLASLLNENTELESDSITSLAKNVLNTDEFVEATALKMKPNNNDDSSGSSLAYEVLPKFPSMAINQDKTASAEVFFNEWSAEEVQVKSLKEPFQQESSVDQPQAEVPEDSNSQENYNMYLPFDILNEHEEAVDMFKPVKDVETKGRSKEEKIMTNRGRSDIPIEDDEDYMEEDYDY